MTDLRAYAVDSAVIDNHIASGPGTPYLIGSFEDVVTELGWRVLSYDLDENDWYAWPLTRQDGNEMDERKIPAPLNLEALAEKLSELTNERDYLRDQLSLAQKRIAVLAAEIDRDRHDFVPDIYEKGLWSGEYCKWTYPGEYGSRCGEHRDHESHCTSLAIIARMQDKRGSLDDVPTIDDVPWPGGIEPY